MIVKKRNRYSFSSSKMTSVHLFGVTVSCLLKDIWAVLTVLCVRLLCLGVFSGCQFISHYVSFGDVVWFDLDSQKYSILF